MCPYVPELPSDYDGGPWSMQTLHHQGTPADSQAPGKWCNNTRTSEHNLFLLGGNLTFLTFKMDNQLRSGCSITYTFIERQSLVSLVFSNKPFDLHFPRNVARFEVYSPVPALPHPQSKCCFVKAALPWILELLTTHFKYTRGSVNDGYVQSLRALILNIYSQKCVPQINEEIEVSGRFVHVCKMSAAPLLLESKPEWLNVYIVFLGIYCRTSQRVLKCCIDGLH